MIRKLLTTVGVTAWAIAMVSWIPLAAVEGGALSQPEKPTTRFSQPMSVKGAIHYVTPEQERWDHWGHIGFLSGWIVGFLAAGGRMWFEVFEGEKELRRFKSSS